MILSSYGTTVKIKWILGLLGLVLLVVSLAGNVWLGTELRSSRCKFNRAWFASTNSRNPEFPMVGLSSVELKQMFDQIESAAPRGDNRLILSVQVLGKNTVGIRTGIIGSPVGGGGRTFRFNRTPTGWKMDEKWMGAWIS